MELCSATHKHISQCHQYQTQPRWMRKQKGALPYISLYMLSQKACHPLLPRFTNQQAGCKRSEASSEKITFKQELKGKVEMWREKCKSPALWHISQRTHNTDSQFFARNINLTVTEVITWDLTTRRKDGMPKVDIRVHPYGCKSADMYGAYDIRKELWIPLVTAISLFHVTY